jgi:hypothetical protein
MDFSLLPTLKQKLIEAKQFSDIMEYFFDHFGDDPAIMNLSEPTRDAVLEQALAQSVKAEFAGKSGAVRLDMRLLQVRDHNFIHGGVTVAGRIGTVIYFPDIEMGLLALSAAPGSNETKFYRFRASPRPGAGTAPSVN